jgi:hypothetical protein
MIENPHIIIVSAASQICCGTSENVELIVVIDCAMLKPEMSMILNNLEMLNKERG